MDVYRLETANMNLYSYINDITYRRDNRLRNDRHKLDQKAIWSRLIGFWQFAIGLDRGPEGTLVPVLTRMTILLSSSAELANFQERRIFFS
jgi:hypothetical protein